MDLRKLALISKILCWSVAGVVMGVVIHFCIQHIDRFITKQSLIKQQATFSEITLVSREKEIRCLARNIYWEAVGEPFEGKVAVAQVTLNRVAHEDFPSNVCDVVYQKTKTRTKVVCQFSWFCERNHLMRPMHPKGYREAEAVARKVLLENYRLDGLTEALYYHADYVYPRWKKTRIAKIGKHIFYEG